jgi:hypothetical protein
MWLQPAALALHISLRTGSRVESSFAAGDRDGKRRDQASHGARRACEDFFARRNILILTTRVRLRAGLSNAGLRHI